MQKTQDALVSFLEELNLKPLVQKESNQVYIIFKIDTQEFPLFFRLYDEGDLLQLLIFFPLQVRPERFNDMARMLHLLNKEIDLPGFGMDEALGLVFHRVMVPLLQETIDPELLQTYLDAMPKISKQFFPAIAGTATTDLSFEEIVKKSAQKKK